MTWIDRLAADKRQIERELDDDDARAAAIAKAQYAALPVEQQTWERAILLKNRALLEAYAARRDGAA